MTQVLADGVSDGEKPVRIALVKHGRIVEFVRRHRAGKTGARQRGHTAITEMAATLCKAGNERQKPEHVVPGTIRSDDPFSQNHIASAFAIDARSPARCRLHA